MRRYSLCIAAVAALAFGRAVNAAEIKLLASNAVKEAYSQLVPEFEKTTGHTVDVFWGGTVDLKRRVGEGEVADLAIMPAEDIDRLMAAGSLAPGSRVDLVKSIIGVAVRPGLPKPDVSSGDKLQAALLEAHSIVLSSGASSVYLLDLFEKKGILAALRPKIKQLAPGLSVGEALARGEGDLGFTQVSEFLHIKGINYIGPLSPDVQHVTTYSAGVLKTAPAAAAARELLQFLTSPRSIPVLKKTGLEPVR